MPVGIERINAKRRQPNARITFIKPLPGATSAYAQDFLERIAAICEPIMKANYVSVMSLEEHEPNPEFAGCNFNTGEVIQLVLRARGTGQWLSFRSVQMVMMHELAHCIQMNHSKAFWAVRNQYVNELRQLWQKGYTGDGLFGRGRTLLSDQYEANEPIPSNLLPSSLCGGTYRTRRGRKRKRQHGDRSNPNLSYAERQQRRIRRKFGVDGVALGDNEDIRAKLEDGKRQKAKPRVANSARGRELRAAAALARFAGDKSEGQIQADEKRSCEEEVDQDSDESDDLTTERMDDTHDGKIIEAKGSQLVRVCSDDDKDDPNIKNEIEELQSLSAYDRAPEQSIVHSTTDRVEQIMQRKLCRGDSNHPENKPRIVPCPVCSMDNSASSILCEACTHVLQPDKVSGTWRCRSGSCADLEYLNSTGVRMCGVCGTSRLE